MSGRQLRMQVGTQRSSLRKYNWGSVLLLREAADIKYFSQYLMSTDSITGSGVDSVAVAMNTKF